MSNKSYADVIPRQLCQEDFRFCLLAPRSKNPTESAWPNGYSIHSTYFQKAVLYNNYGVVTGHGKLIIIDCDSDKACYLVEKYLPTGFKVNNPSTKGYGHYYFIVEDMPDDGLPRCVLECKEHGHLGEILCNNNQAVGPGSIHPAGGYYYVQKDMSIPVIKQKQVTDIFHPYMKATKPRNNNNDQTCGRIHFTVFDLITTTGLTPTATGYMGCHPVHGSTTGHNFAVTNDGYGWFCFRHWVGGNPLDLRCILNGECDCVDLYKYKERLFRLEV